jgi:RNA polymerase sigma-B factor
MRSEGGRSPSAVELAERVGVSIEDVLDGLYAASARDGDPIELSADDHDDAPAHGDTLGVDDAGYDRVDQAVTAERLMTQLSDVERRVLRLRFHQDLTQSEVALALGCSQMQVSRIQRRAMAKLTEIAHDPAELQAA